MTGTEKDAQTPHSIRTRPQFRAVMGPAARIVAILHVEEADAAEPLLQALEAGGIGLIEVTLRTRAALDVIARMRVAARSAVIGAGTLTRPDQFALAKDAGAQFLVGPAFSTRLADAAGVAGLPFLPGATSPSEILAAVEAGFNELKFFPADLNGGLNWIRHMRPLFPEVSFCPTGGITNENLAEYLSEPNIVAVGGMFMSPRAEIEAGAWDRISAMARNAVAAASADQAAPERAPRH
ncbi:MAG: bifunctional 4-hydroxy-2-oxoglutarate aldolase/2-dehydro-3-deoxy-phosphogluconate aldolase [Mesorhizobium sp.]|uniref:bifunctional 4-hydroxy-2-oxoglutarate aldolase/2-dehydro-3-deoxy-phosphogluconate aldolase n=1 Tax=Mesorhizobium sp. TaxID=1871066 RepID=UPI000FE694AB|nr:bifunctional 4-hydroxy-2-oxoglutarate aldolase/2-dehydro-3-deoxy-phosphogluconate aldolase [Mesorhizobium sp.]RWB75889.1 MAG: bifunctional 4-hydroxy-2-oxoglutarate aldolase/2-dehydro-3-deoxy-phosphogluconate aldolase [Mesorhizobium sp.]